MTRDGRGVGHGARLFLPDGGALSLGVFASTFREVIRPSSVFFAQSRALYTSARRTSAPSCPWRVGKLVKGLARVSIPPIHPHHATESLVVPLFCPKWVPFPFLWRYSAALFSSRRAGRGCARMICTLQPARPLLLLRLDSSLSTAHMSALDRLPHLGGFEGMRPPLIQRRRELQEKAPCGAVTECGRMTGADSFALEEDCVYTPQWSTDSASIEAPLASAKAEGAKAKVLVVISGNPRHAAHLPHDGRAHMPLPVVRLAHKVWQSNRRDGKRHPFTSFKKVVRDLGQPPLVSFHIISMGVSGECMRRGGHFELTNIGPEVRPPKEGESSYALWKSATDAIHAALASRTKIMVQRLNALPGVSLKEVAREAGKEPDAFYALAMLDGICVVPGSGFGQQEGEWHYRSVPPFLKSFVFTESRQAAKCLCPGVEEYAEKLERFHLAFVEKYGSV
ncbi:hypothetical protein B0H12DRAFT_1075726 [Mycena haematopus]|nr:hypothetical protein B0H12DRAFT_1075726 [Mycena haematopus]